MDQVFLKVMKRRFLFQQKRCASVWNENADKL